MTFIDLAKLSFGAVFAYKLRSALTILGILVGIGSVVVLTSIGEGVRVYVVNEFTQFGTNIVAVVPGKTETFGISGATISTVRPLTIDDLESLKRINNVMAVVPVVQGNANVEYGSRSRRAIVLGVNSKVPEVWKMPVGSGRFLPEDSMRASRAFAVLGSKMRDELFGNTNPLGQRIRVGGDRYRVIGVMASKGQLLGFDLDDTIYLPIDKALEMFNREGLMEIDILYEGGTSVDKLTENIKRNLIARHGDEDFTIITQDKMLDVLGSILDILTLGVAAIGGISLLVGAVGILTIMTISVTERISEIGLLRALGARRSHILHLFLGEAVFLSVIGGLLGVLAAIVLVFMLKLFLPALPIEIAWIYVIIALVLASLIGVITGIIPAIRAASMQPLEALRTE
jgi:putative ABC transport system permease protein